MFSRKKWRKLGFWRYSCVRDVVYEGNWKSCCTRGVLVLLLVVFCFCCCYCIFSLIIYHFFYFDVPTLGFDERSARETFWSEEWLTTYRHKVHEYLNSLYIFRFSWTAQNTWPNPTIIHTWFRGLGRVSNVSSKTTLCWSPWHKNQTGSSNKTQRIKENTLRKKKVALISFTLPPAHFICAENWLRCRIATFLERISPFYNYSTCSTTFTNVYFHKFITSQVTPLTLI